MLKPVLTSLVYSVWMAGLLVLTVPAGEKARGVTQKKVVYKKVGKIELHMDIFTPAQQNSKKVRPCIVFFHGGGWNGGAPGQFYPQCQYLAERGMVAISVEYRLRKTHGVTPKECLQDAKSAIRWVRKHAAELGIDPSKLAAGGGSAGGHLAAATAVCEGFDDPQDDLSISCVPNALVLLNPVIDNSKEGFGYRVVKEYWRKFSPLHNIRKGVPPTIFLIGTKDRLIPVKTANDFKARIEAVGGRCDLVFYPEMGHGFFNKPEYREKTLQEIDRFLCSLGYLQPQTP
ncbi:MAG: alpha/beta hydrolase [Lentisphaerae bacterium]|nr:MAG: alpha/beta hydrolase [Lentisphaerota bacterium]